MVQLLRHFARPDTGFLISAVARGGATPRRMGRGAMYATTIVCSTDMSGAPAVEPREERSDEFTFSCMHAFRDDYSAISLHILHQLQFRG